MPARPEADAVRAAPYLVAWIPALTVPVGALAGGPWSFLTVFWVFGLVALLDQLGGRATGNLAPAREAAADGRLGPRLIVWGCVPVQAALLGFVLWFVGVRGTDPLTATGLAVSTGVVTGAIGITAAHELMHRTARAERALAWLLMASVNYAHFCVEHVHGHHRRVATPEDPASARRGESFWRFLPRTLFGGLRSALQIERARLARRGRAPLGPGNRVLRGLALQAALLAAVTLAFGPAGLALYLGQSAVAVLELELINYVEHYGLTRRRRPDGGYEPVGARHSWDSAQRIGNWSQFNLLRHADHHLRPGRRYPSLRHLPEAAQLPAGYAAMAPLALLPPLWFRVMDPRLDALTAGGLSASQPAGAVRAGRRTTT